MKIALSTFSSSVFCRTYVSISYLFYKNYVNIEKQKDKRMVI